MVLWLLLAFCGNVFSAVCVYDPFLDRLSSSLIPFPLCRLCFLFFVFRLVSPLHSRPLRFADRRLYSPSFLFLRLHGRPDMFDRWFLSIVFHPTSGGSNPPL